MASFQSLLAVEPVNTDTGIWHKEFWMGRLRKPSTHTTWQSGGASGGSSDYCRFHSSHDL